jgi:hypothetical protein
MMFKTLRVAMARFFVATSLMLLRCILAGFRSFYAWATMPESTRAVARATPRPTRLPASGGLVELRPVEAASQIFHLSYGGGWKVHVLVYQSNKRVVRVLKPATAALEARVRSRFGKTKFELPEASLNGVSVEAVLEDTQKIAGHAIEQLQRKMRASAYAAARASHFSASRQVEQRPALRRVA